MLWQQWQCWWRCYYSFNFAMQCKYFFTDNFPHTYIYSIYVFVLYAIKYFSFNLPYLYSSTHQFRHILNMWIVCVIFHIGRVKMMMVVGKRKRLKEYVVELRQSKNASQHQHTIQIIIYLRGFVTAMAKKPNRSHPNPMLYWPCNKKIGSSCTQTHTHFAEYSTTHDLSAIFNGNFVELKWMRNICRFSQYKSISCATQLWYFLRRSNYRVSWCLYLVKQEYVLIMW